MGFDREKLLATDGKAPAVDDDVVEFEQPGKRTRVEELLGGRSLTGSGKVNTPGKRTLVEETFGCEAGRSLTGSGKGNTPGRRTLVEETPGHQSDGFDAFRMRGVRDVLATLQARGDKKLAESFLAISTKPARPDPTQQVMLRVAERRAATLYRHAVDDGEVQTEDPSVDYALCAAWVRMNSGHPPARRSAGKAVRVGRPRP